MFSRFLKPMANGVLEELVPGHRTTADLKQFRRTWFRVVKCTKIKCFLVFCNFWYLAERGAPFNFKAAEKRETSPRFKVALNLADFKGFQDPSQFYTAICFAYKDFKFSLK